MTKEAIAVDVDGDFGVIVVVEILFRHNKEFDRFDILWTEQSEPNPIDITDVMVKGNGLRLFQGGIISWDQNEVVAMIVRLKDYEQEKEEKDDQGANHTLPWFMSQSSRDE